MMILAHFAPLNVSTLSPRGDDVGGCSARGIKGRTLGRLVVGLGQYRVQGRRHEGSVMILTFNNYKGRTLEKSHIFHEGKGGTLCSWN